MTADKQIKTLLPCPFCGGAAEIDESCNHHSVFCLECGAMPDLGYGSVYDRTKKQAIHEWNTRAAIATTHEQYKPLVEALQMTIGVLSVAPTSPMAGACGQTMESTMSRQYINRVPYGLLMELEQALASIPKELRG